MRIVTSGCKNSGMEGKGNCLAWAFSASAQNILKILINEKEVFLKLVRILLIDTIEKTDQMLFEMFNIFSTGF